jgi:hypothetical protein
MGRLLRLTDIAAFYSPAPYELGTSAAPSFSSEVVPAGFPFISAA